MSKNIEQKPDSLDKLVRDACSVVPVPKTEYRRRIERYATERAIEELEALRRDITVVPSIPAATNFSAIIRIDMCLAELRGDTK